MSKSGKPVSEKALGAPQSPSVYDFLYCDTRRIGSFLAQFDDSGHLEKVVQKDAVTVGAKRGYKIALGGGGTLAGTGAQGSAGFEISPEAGGSEASERVYDPLWTNALTFLDYLDGAGLIQRGVKAARIGQFVLASGNLALFDFNFLKVAWENPYLKNVIAPHIMAGQTIEEPAAVNRKQRHNRPQSKEPTLAEGVFDLLKVTPHAIVASMQDDVAIWCNLSEVSLVGKSSDILLKHGASVAGEWTMLGILDAVPDEHEMVGDIDVTQLKQLATVGGLGSLGAMVVAYAPMIRTMLGRPTSSYGITPLLIFRQVAG